MLGVPAAAVSAVRSLVGPLSPARGSTSSPTTRRASIASTGHPTEVVVGAIGPHQLKTATHSPRARRIRTPSQAEPGPRSKAAPRNSAHWSARTSQPTSWPRRAMTSSRTRPFPARRSLTIALKARSSITMRPRPATRKPLLQKSMRRYQTDRPIGSCSICPTVPLTLALSVSGCNAGRSVASRRSS